MLQIALTVGAAANLVFCSAASGHVAIESAFNADCCEKPPSAQRFTKADDDCGCTDTPLLQSPIEARSRSTQMLAPLAVALHSAATFAAVPSPFRTHAWAWHGLVPEPRLISHRSIVLLL